jgi:hypothetical protein
MLTVVNDFDGGMIANVKARVLTVRSSTDEGILMSPNFEKPQRIVKSRIHQVLISEYSGHKGR